MTLHHFIAMNFDLEREQKLKLNLTPEELKTKYGGKLEQEIEGKLYDILSNLFLNLVGLPKIIIPGEFTTSRGAHAISCSQKAAEGYLFPLKSSLVFIHKPVTYVRHSELKNVVFMRTGGGSLSRTFDLKLVRVKDQQETVFLSIDKDEQKTLHEYFKKAGIKIVVQDSEGNATELQKSPVKGQAQELDDGDDEESEDESFNAGDEGSDDDEEGEAEDEEASEMPSEDVDMVDSSVDKNELKALQKEPGVVDVKAGRPKRGQKK